MQSRATFLLITALGLIGLTGPVQGEQNADWRKASYVMHVADWQVIRGAHGCYLRHAVTDNASEPNMKDSPLQLLLIPGKAPILLTPFYWGLSGTIRISLDGVEIHAFRAIDVVMNPLIIQLPESLTGDFLLGQMLTLEVEARGRGKVTQSFRLDGFVDARILAQAESCAQPATQLVAAQ